jgi:hypothetical protein
MRLLVHVGIETFDDARTKELTNGGTGCSDDTV